MATSKKAAAPAKKRTAAKKKPELNLGSFLIGVAFGHAIKALPALIAASAAAEAKKAARKPVAGKKVKKLKGGNS